MTTAPVAVDERHAPSALPELDDAIATLNERKRAWLDLPVAKKASYARGLVDNSAAVAPRQVAAALAAKGLAADSPRAGEEWMAGPYPQVRTLRLLTETLEEIRDRGRVEIDPRRVRVRPSGQVAVEVFPDGTLDRLLFAGFTAEVWMEPGVTRENLSRHVGNVYNQERPEPAVALVLGAGNVASIAPLDVAHKLFAEGQVALLKLNPVNDYLGPFLEEIFADLIADGFVRVAYGGAEVGEYLTRHPGIDTIHITGSDRTHDAIVFGTGPEGAARKAAGEPLLEKPITSELGNVSPMILVPGPWTDYDLQFQAENVATQMVQNAGFNCNATKVIVTSRDWPQREAFLDRLRSVLTRLPPRPAYYPGAEERWERFVGTYPQAEALGERREGVVPPALIPGLDPDTADPLAFEEESFCAVTAEVTLPGGDPADFLARAVDFANDRLTGTLNAGMVLHPHTERQLGGAVEEAVATLRYGSVAVNHWPALAFALGSTPWGAFPGHTLSDIGSGLGVVHNTRLFDRPQKSYIHGPFRVFPKPPWFVTHGNTHRVGPKMVRLEADPGFLKLPAVALATLLG